MKLYNLVGFDGQSSPTCCLVIVDCDFSRQHIAVVWSRGTGTMANPCSAGNLVRTPSECPSTDLCPLPPTAPNTVTNCNLRESDNPQISKSQLNIPDREAVSISTDKPVYKMGEIVNIKINNTGTDPLIFSNSILGLKIENSITHEKYPLIAAQVITTLDSGGSRTLKWSQMNSFGHQVEEGNYTATTSTGVLSANATFTIIN